MMTNEPSAATHSKGAQDRTAGSQQPDASDDASDIVDQKRRAEAEDGTEATIASLQNEKKELEGRLLRTLADMENLRRRTDRELRERAQYAVSGIAKDIAGILDNFGRALASMPEEASAGNALQSNFRKGVELIAKDLSGVLERHGVNRLDVMGKAFDPNLHEALFEVADNSVPPGTIVEEVEPGYTIGERVLRAAKVGISNSSGPNA